MNRVSVFIDGANMYYAQKRLGWFIDFRKVLVHFQSSLNASLAAAFYYTAADASARTRDASFHDYLVYSGYTLRLRCLKAASEETAESADRVELGVDISVDLFNTIDLYDTAILMSGSGAFDRAVEALRSRGKRVIVVAHPEMTARELRNAAGINFQDLRALEPVISRTDRAPDSEDADERASVGPLVAPPSCES